MKKIMSLSSIALVLTAMISSLASANSLEVQVAYDCGEDLPKILEFQNELHLYLGDGAPLEVFKETALANLKRSTGYFLEIESDTMAYLWKNGDSDVFDCAKP